MPTIRIQDWTKKRLEEIRKDECHSSFDSVIKALLRDQQIAQLAPQQQTNGVNPKSSLTSPSEKQFAHLTVLAELTSAEQGTVFLSCPNCGAEVSHLSVEGSMTVSIFEMTCQQCLVEHNQYSLVAAEISYPLEKRIEEGTHLANLQAAATDYWDRTLEVLGSGSTSDAVNPERMVYHIARHSKQLDWDWPVDTPVVCLEVGESYTDERTDESFTVLEKISTNRNELNGYRIRTEQPGGKEMEEELLKDNVMDLLTSRSIYKDT